MPVKHWPIVEVFVAYVALFSVVVRKDHGLINCNSSVLVKSHIFCAHSVNGVAVGGFSKETQSVHNGVSCCYIGVDSRY